MLTSRARNARNRRRCRVSYLPLALVSSSCVDTDGGLSYGRDVQPLLEEKCASCHHSDNNAGIVDIEDAFTQDFPPGLVGSLNTWAQAHPGSLPYNVVPFEPENSFVMRKITDESLRVEACDRAVTTECPTDSVGEFMPQQLPRVTEGDMAAIRQWIIEGAEDTPFFRSQVAPIFGDPSDFSSSAYLCGFCHYPGTPSPPHFMDPFDPVEGIVNVPSRIRDDLDLVEPGEPDASLLVLKLEATADTEELGAPMPRSYPALSADEVALIERWIREGAKNN